MNLEKCLLQHRRFLHEDAPLWGCVSGGPVQMLTAKPTCRVSRKEKVGGSVVCWQTPSSDLLISLLMTHPAAEFFLCLKGQWGWEKPTGRQAGKEWGSSPDSTLGLAWRVTYLLQMSPSAKTALWEAERDMESYLDSPRLKLGSIPNGWLERTSMEKTEFHLLGVSKYHPTTPR